MSHLTWKKEQAMKYSVGKRSQKRGREFVVESSESSDSDVVIGNGQNVGTAGSNPRRSTWQKHDISCNEVKSDEVDGFMNPKYKKSRMGNANANVQTRGTTSTSMAKVLHGREQGRSDKAYSNAAADCSSGASGEPDSVSYPGPEFCDFDKERDENKFSVNQIWAIYDSLDAMPRYYALIRQVHGPKFKLRFTWLEYEPTGRAETLWYKADLPVACGSFKLGKSGHTHERVMFSHLMPWRTTAKKNAYGIFPGKGEVWALFKNWWGSYVDIDRRYEYELVEVLLDLTDGDVITVVRLVKIQGFVSLFVRAADKGLSPLKIQLKDVLQFSHKIPSYRLVGHEREGIPKGSLELDCASLPVNFSEMFPPVRLWSCKAGVDDSDNVCNGLNFKSSDNEEEVSTCTTNNGSMVFLTGNRERSTGQKHDISYIESLADVSMSHSIKSRLPRRLVDLSIEQIQDMVAEADAAGRTDLSDQLILLYALVEELHSSKREVPLTALIEELQKAQEENVRYQTELEEIDKSLTATEFKVAELETALVQAKDEVIELGRRRSALVPLDPQVIQKLWREALKQETLDRISRAKVALLETEYEKLLLGLK